MTSTGGASNLTAEWRSPAKVNLCLRIVGRRRDGYHLLDSIFVPVDLCDRITARAERLGRGKETAVRVRCAYPGVPEDASNLAARAAVALLAEADSQARVDLTIEKTIPPGTGLGGGSGNAASVLAGLNALLGLGVTRKRLSEIAVGLGADVPFFLYGQVARVRGIGEDVQPITGWPDLRLVIAVPSVAVSTSWAFAALRATEMPLGGTEPEQLAAGAAPAAGLLVNDLERVVLPAFPAVAALKKQLLEAGASAAVMSGSGSAVVGIAPSVEAAIGIEAAVRQASPEVRVHSVGIFREATRGDPVCREADRQGG